MRVALFAIGLFGVALAAHAAEPSAVQITRDSAAVTGCGLVGEVRASSMMGGLLTSTGYNRAVDQLKAKAAALGATHVVLIDASSGMSGSRMLGAAYACAKVPATGPGIG